MPYDSTPHHGPLYSDTMTSLRQFFDARNHHPSDDQWAALADLTQTLERMADGTLEAKLFLSSLDPGVGKSTAIIRFLISMMSSQVYADTGAIVCLFTKAEIEKMFDELAMPANDICIITADEKLNALGAGPENADKAQVILTTQQRIEWHLKGKSFDDAEQFFYQGKPRTVRVWDEAFVPGRVANLTDGQISGLIEPTKGIAAKFSDWLRDFTGHLLLNKDPNEKLMQLPDFEETFGVSLNDLLRHFDERRKPNVARVDDDKLQNIEDLWLMSGRTVNVRNDKIEGQTLVNFEETLPHDLAPLVITDASGRIRETYRLMKEGRDSVVELKSAAKDYANLTLHVWNKGGGKGAFDKRNQDRRGRLITGIVNTIQEHPNDRWLIVHHKKDWKVGDVRKDIEEELVSIPGTVDFVTWGNHRATNAFADARRVILAGTLFYRLAYYEAHARMALDRPAEDGAISSEIFNRTRLGEHKHLLLQAICRGAVRRSDGAGCHPMDAYVVAHVSSGIRGSLAEVFPGATVEKWQPVPVELGEKAQSAYDFIVASLDFAKDGEVVNFTDVVKATEVSKQYFKELRKNEDFIQALAEQGIVEGGKKYMTHFKRANGSGSTATG
jgi:hypothetical protein